MQKITTCLWFDNQAEEAAEFYCSLFEDSKILDVMHYGEGAHKPAGSVLMVTFVLQGTEFQALNGGPEFHFTEATSLSVSVEGQEENDRLWNALTEGGEESQCGWLKDRYGLSWQIVPTQLMALLSDPEPGRAYRATQAMFAMQRIDIAAVQAAADAA
jgi:predicted 3-demethylubiquinone-9 3-methyltransferase (glyoxalase superfamily)